MQRVTKLEDLSNELFIECFEYLSARDIFHSFDRLNCRFDELIHNIPLHLNFDHVRKIVFDQLCSIISANSDIKKQIHSLKLSNIDTIDQIHLFLSYFSLDEFISLRSLTLIGINKKNLDASKSVLSLLSKSCSIHIIDPQDELKGEVPQEPRKIVQRHLPLLFQLSSVTHLTLPSCSCLDLSHVLEHLSLLEYVKINSFDPGRWTKLYQTFSNQHAVHLKQLVIILFRDVVKNFEMLLRQTPNLKYLVISYNGVYMIDAPRWENLITSLLPLLTTFKFRFFHSFTNRENKTLLSNKFKQFQTEFWTKQHHWHTEHVFEPNRASIYTISYLPSVIDYNDIPRNSPAINNITDLTVPFVNLEDNHEHYLKNVKTLRITKACFTPDDDEEDFSVSSKKHIPETGEYVEYLKMIMNLSYLQSVDFTKISVDDISSLLLEIFKQAPSLLSLTVHSWNLKFMIENYELCGYLNKMIKKLDTPDHHSLINTDVTGKKFCEIFSNLEQLSCTIDEPSDLFLLINRSKNLSIVNVVFELDLNPKIMPFIEDEAKKGNLLFQMDSILFRDGCYVGHVTKLILWIGNDAKKLNNWKIFNIVDFFTSFFK